MGNRPAEVCLRLDILLLNTQRIAETRVGSSNLRIECDSLAVGRLRFDVLLLMPQCNAESVVGSTIRRTEGDRLPIRRLRVHEATLL